MSSEKRWRELGQGQFFKWETAGQEVEGTWQGTKPGKFGDLGIVETSEGRMTFPLHTTLARDMQLVKDGADVKIVYLGKKKTKDGARDFKAFKVFITSEADVDVEQPDADDVPF